MVNFVPDECVLIWMYVGGWSSWQNIPANSEYVEIERQSVEAPLRSYQEFWRSPANRGRR
jgi:hypothetical protein